MKLLSISTRNFRLHAESDVTFEPEGVTGIVGSNEAGKSTLLEAAVWALFGADTTRGTKAGLRWNRAPARRVASATLRFEVGGRTYRVERTESGAKLWDEEGGRCIADGTKPVNQHVPTLLGMSYAEFAASFLCSQKDLARISTMLPTERVAFIRQVLGMGKIDAGLAACRKRKGELAQECAGLEAGLGQRDPFVRNVTEAEQQVVHAESTGRVRESELRVATDAAVATAEALAASQARKERHDAVARRTHDAVNVLTAARIEIERLDQRVEQERVAVERLAAVAPELERVPALRDERDRLVSARAAQQQREMLTRSITALEREIPDLRERMEDAARQVTFYDEAAYVEAMRLSREAMARLEKMRSEREGYRAKRLAERDTARREADTLLRKIDGLERIGRDADCPTCLRALDDAFDAVLRNLRDQMHGALGQAAAADEQAEAASDPSDDELAAEVERDEAEKEVERHRQLKADALLGKKQAEDLRVRLQKAESDFDSDRERLARLPGGTFDPGILAAIESDLQRLEALDRSLSSDRGLAAHVEYTRAQLASWREKKAEADEQFARAEEEKREIGFLPAAHTQIEEIAKRAQSAEADARVALGRAEESERHARAALRVCERALADYDARAERLARAAAEHLTYERTAARLAEFRVAIASTIRPEMEEYMSGFVSLLTDGRHEAVSLDEEFGATLYESGVPVEVVSGGTEDVAALAMRLALSQMIAERAGHPLELLILDEPFGSLDATRRGNVLGLIRRLRSTFRQVIVISHVEETRDAVDHVVELEFDEPAGMTRVVGAARLAGVA